MIYEVVVYYGVEEVVVNCVVDVRILVIIAPATRGMHETRMRVKFSARFRRKKYEPAGAIR